MNIFTKKSPSLTTARDRRTLLDAGEAFHLVNTQLATNISRLSAIVHMLGGSYPIPQEDIGPAPDDLVGRVFFDLDFTQICVNELSEHISQLERVCGLPVNRVDAPTPVPSEPQLYDPDEEAPSA